ncbi:hypothetical protein PPYR_05601 [Photinus pyralis]|uniref:alkaline phosphatase n=1 Tax=Photinus pyralis TaxID=7054 RepID=A0A5N4AV95_PHOPY|nr:hypothetical protein PPYR_05601 [Photinus pyralis]
MICTIYPAAVASRVLPPSVSAHSPNSISTPTELKHSPLPSRWTLEDPALPGTSRHFYARHAISGPKVLWDSYYNRLRSVTFLLLSGGRIDHAHHYNNAYRALDETLAMETALLAALSMVNPTETLIVVTSDHSHVLTMGGQATPRGHPILGPDSKVSDIDGQPYSTILYGNGPGYSTPRTVPINTTTQNEDRNQVHGAAVPRQWATHGGEDVPVYALGPLATILFTGTFDQSYIPHAIAYSACLGEHAQRCQGVDNYTACIVPEVSSVSAAGAPVVIASSVMADDGARAKSIASKESYNVTCILIITLIFAVT